MKNILRVLLIVVSILGISVQTEAVTLNFLEVVTSPERTKLYKELIAEYEAEHPDIKINLISPPYEQAIQKATLMLNTNQDVDIVEVPEYTVPQYVNNGKLLDLSEYYEAWEGSETLLYVAREIATAVDNTPYMIPQSIFVKALFLRPDILSKYGIEGEPETFEELVDMAQKVTNPDKNQYGFAWRGKIAEMKFSDIFVSAWVAEIKDSEYFYSEDETFFTHPDYKKGMEKYIELFHTASPPDGINWGFNEQINGFVSGITPILIQDPDSIPLLNKMLGEDKYKVVPLPLGPHGYTYLEYGINGLAITSYSEHKEEAWEFIKWISSPEKNGYFNENYGALPVHTATYEENAYFQSEHYQAYYYEMNNPDKYIRKAYPVNSSKWPGWGQIHEVDMQQILLGKMDLETALQKWEDYWEK